MDAVTVFRVISLIPDRTLRAPSGCVFNASAQPERIALLAKFLSWLGPLDPVSKEDQQRLCVRSTGAKPLEPGEEPPLEAGEEPPLDELGAAETFDEEATVRLPGAGTHIAA